MGVSGRCVTGSRQEGNREDDLTLNTQRSPGITGRVYLRSKEGMLL